MGRWIDGEENRHSLCHFNYIGIEAIKLAEIDHVVCDDTVTISRG